MILPHRVRIKFEQIKLTDHFKNTDENEFPVISLVLKICKKPKKVSVMD